MGLLSGELLRRILCLYCSPKMQMAQGSNLRPSWEIWLQVAIRITQGSLGTSIQKSGATDYSPFFMVYGCEAILPMDVAFVAPRIQNYDEAEAEAHLLWVATLTLSRLERARTWLLRRWPGPPSNPAHGGCSQALFSMGRALYTF